MASRDDSQAFVQAITSRPAIDSLICGVETDPFLIERTALVFKPTI